MKIAMRRVICAAGLALPLVGCAAHGRVAYVGYDAAANVVTLWTATETAAKAICSAFGVDEAKLQAMAYAHAGQGQPFWDPRSGLGCYLGPGTPGQAGNVHVIVCPRGSRYCAEHERAHARGLRHPDER